MMQVDVSCRFHSFFVCGQFTIQVADKDAYPDEVPGPIFVNGFLYSVKHMIYIYRGVLVPGELFYISCFYTIDFVEGCSYCLSGLHFCFEKIQVLGGFSPTQVVSSPRSESSPAKSLPAVPWPSPPRSLPERPWDAVSPTLGFEVQSSPPASIPASPRRSPPRSSQGESAKNASVRARLANAVPSTQHDDFSGVDPLLAHYARPLLNRLRGPAENLPSAADFCNIPVTEDLAGARSLRQCFSQVEHFAHSKDDLEAAGARPLPSRLNSLPVDVALLCLSRVTGFPDKLVKQVFETMKAACLHKDLELHIKSSLKILPRVPSIGVAAPGSKKTPVQQELINRVFCKVVEKFPFLAHNNGSQGEHLLFDGGSTAGFLKQLRQNNGYVYLVVEELVSFFGPGYAASGNTNTGQRIAPSTLLPLRTGNGISRSLASDLGNRIERTQAAMSMMGQEDVVRKFFCAKGMFGSQFRACTRGKAEIGLLK